MSNVVNLQIDKKNNYEAIQKEASRLSSKIDLTENKLSELRAISDRYRNDGYTLISDRINLCAEDLQNEHAYLCDSYNDLVG